VTLLMTATSISSAMLSGELSRMSELDNAMMQHISHIVFTEKRPFSYRDFLSFEIDDKEYEMDHGTFRNKVLKLKKEGEVELEYRSMLAFYTIKGVNFRKIKSTSAMKTMMTPNHMEVLQCHCHCHHHDLPKKIIVQDTTPPICNIIENLPLNKKSLHDIHMRFEVPNIHTILLSWLDTTSPQDQRYLQINSVNKGISLPTWNIKDLNIKVTVHRTNTVSVVVGCSYAPIATDIGGVIRLSNALTRVEERISRLVEDKCKLIQGGYENVPIPEHDRWIVTMWHFGADASVEYTGKEFSATWEVGENALIRAYSKDMKDGKTRIRLERQEYPRKIFADAIEEKLYLNRGGSNSY
jgi:hypothetical protein